jgi:hypothetical protein
VLSSSTADGGVGTDGGIAEKEVRCFAKDDQPPHDSCLVCDPDNDPEAWTPANGGYCDDGDLCTRDDYCQEGVCKGVDYAAECSDEFSCTEDLCDGQGGCIGNQLKSDWCLINGVCHPDQTTHPGGSCFICDPSVNQSDWSQISDTCLIDSMCYTNGEKHPLGCAECDPSEATDAWTVKGNDCLIEDTCYAAGTKDTLGCSQCDPASDQYGWTPLSGVCFIAGQCHNDGDPHPQGCAECDPSSNNTAWTVTDATKCLVNDNCVDKANSIMACGACGVVCGPGESCADGVCSCGSLSGTVGSGAVCGATESCDQGQCVTLPPGTLVIPLSLDFESSDGGLTGTLDWEWGNLGPWAPGLDCDSTAEPPPAGHSGLGVWATKLNDCYSPAGNADNTCNNSDPTDDSILSFKVKIPANLTTVTMTFWQWRDFIPTFDWTEIRVDGDVVAQTCTSSSPTPSGWTERSVDLSAYIGKIVEVGFHMLGLFNDQDDLGCLGVRSWPQLQEVSARAGQLEDVPALDLGTRCDARGA